MASNMAVDTLNLAPNNNGGYDYDFISTPPDRVVCKICHLPSRDPYLSVCCGHVFCKCCVDNVKTSTITNVCPVCRDEEFVIFPNKQLDREIKGLYMNCSNNKKGCNWQGELNEINSRHLENSDGCQFEEVKCLNECGKMIERRYLTSHVEIACSLRKVSCQYCHDTGEHQFIEDQHREECRKLPLPCLNKCEVGSILREDMEAHRKECPLEMIQCEYQDVGCEVRMLRKDQERHENEEMKKHLVKTKHELTSTKVTLADTERKLTDTNNQLTSALQRIGTLEVLLYLATDKVVARPTSRAVVLESSLRWSDKLVAMAMMSKSGDQECPVIMKMPQYIKEKIINDGTWYSDPFYTHNNGYKMSLGVHAAGDGKGKGTHLSVFLYLKKGPHDDKLTWPLRGKFEIKLLNQISDSEHHSETVTYDDDVPKYCADRVKRGDRAGSGYGRPKFILNKDLSKNATTHQYLKNDCLFFLITKL